MKDRVSVSTEDRERGVEPFKGQWEAKTELANLANEPLGGTPENNTGDLGQAIGEMRDLAQFHGGEGAVEIQQLPHAGRGTA